MNIHIMHRASQTPKLYTKAQPIEKYSFLSALRINLKQLNALLCSSMQFYAIFMLVFGTALYTFYVCSFIVFYGFYVFRKLILIH